MDQRDAQEPVERGPTPAPVAHASALDAGDAVRYEHDRPVAVGDLRLAQPTTMATTSAGFWGLYEAGDEVLVVHPAGALRGPADQVRDRLAAVAGDQERDDADREAARSFLPFLGGDDPNTP
jgi:hypothetical protein